ncbi:hypothetical protein KIN20_019119 [Parelaphostrongylus tenuis]|uniref:Uncharacterized protein n=1 Tax=Parelaphostrongylus tenuis TaxID=148309 RepID=A0AAD5MR36_PARTN|nr:hypothetical protein KIN20_019119 [Parelaphostrongylus tenuis]
MQYKSLVYENSDLYGKICEGNLMYNLAHHEIVTDLIGKSLAKCDLRRRSPTVMNRKGEQCEYSQNLMMT